MESQFYQINLLKILFKWKWHLLAITIIAVVFAVVFSGPSFITPKFKSNAVVYPANIAPYADENETEQMLQIFNSLDITDNVIKDLSLGKHYQLDESDPKYLSTLYYIYNSNLSISKTPNGAISIEVFDADPNIAMEIVNKNLYFYNQKVKELHTEKFGEVVELYERAMNKRKVYMDSLQERLTFLGTEYSLLDYESQSQEVARGTLKTIDGNGAAYVKDSEVKKLKKNLEDKGGELLMITSLIAAEAGQYADLQREYERALINYDREFTYYNILTKPFAADSKSTPVRFIIVLITALATFFTAYFIILLVENLKGVSNK